jgi:tetratricopeptide (TPR) repeat protein
MLERNPMLLKDSKKKSEIMKAAGDVLLEENGLEECIPFYEGALRFADSAQEGPIIECLAEAWAKLGKYEEAVHLYSRALALCLKQLGPNAPECQAIAKNIAFITGRAPEL